MTPAAILPDGSSAALAQRLARIRERAQERAGEGMGPARPLPCGADAQAADDRDRRDPRARQGPTWSHRIVPDASAAQSTRSAATRERLVLAELGVLLSLIAQIEGRGPDAPTTAETPFEFAAAVMVVLFALPERQAYDLLARAAERLARRWVAIAAPDPRDPALERTGTPVVQAIDYLPARGRMRLYLAPKILPYLPDLVAAYRRQRLGCCAREVGGEARRQREAVGLESPGDSAAMSAWPAASRRPSRSACVDILVPVFGAEARVRA